MSAFDFEQFRKEWRGLCARIAERSGGEVEIDPLEGVTGFQSALLAARRMTVTHDTRAAIALADHARKHPGLFGREERVYARMRRGWWQRSSYWIYGAKLYRTRGPDQRPTPWADLALMGETERPPEVEACASTLKAARAVEADREKLKLGDALNRRFRREANREFRLLVSEVMHEEQTRRLDHVQSAQAAGD